MNRQDLPNILFISLEALNGKADIVHICKYIWDNFECELKTAGNLFYTWQYDIRWAAMELRKSGLMKPAADSCRGVWELK